MKTLKTIDEFVEAAMGFDAEAHPGNLFVSQAPENGFGADEVLMGDEDSVRKQVMQVFEVLLETERGSYYFHYPFSDPAEIEEIVAKLEPVYERFPKLVLQSEEMAEKVAVA
ncbi:MULTISPECIES: hypothetical protein [Bhargavaea]|uniref:Uncharacterized protein n=1 Tax=Bhargavaea changchunensis TaxID=2134037 RepID=A0ABW2ND31_9BACL|nr:hypothetical protein [Bhargavaea sp. CC-171006]